MMISISACDAVPQTYICRMFFRLILSNIFMCVPCYVAEKTRQVDHKWERRWWSWRRLLGSSSCKTSRKSRLLSVVKKGRHLRNVVTVIEGHLTCETAHICAFRCLPVSCLQSRWLTVISCLRSKHKVQKYSSYIHRRNKIISQC